jgi:hypothetical protein
VKDALHLKYAPRTFRYTPERETANPVCVTAQRNLSPELSPLGSVVLDFVLELGVDVAKCRLDGTCAV